MILIDATKNKSKATLNKILKSAKISISDELSKQTL